MEKHYKLVLFDFDKTLYVGRFFALRLVLANLPFAMRVKAERQVRHSLSGLDLGGGEALRAEFASRLAALIGVSASEAAVWYADAYLKSMPRLLAAYPARPGAVEVIGELLDAGVRVAVLSDYPSTRERLAAIGIADERLLCLSAEDFGALKPAPRPFVETARLAGVAPADTLVVGDRADNVGEGAKAAGMDCLLIKGKRATGADGFEALPWEGVLGRLRQIAGGSAK